MNRLLPGLALLLASWLWLGCSDDTECSADQDCPGDKICRANSCVTPDTGSGGGEGDYCRVDTACDPPLICDKAVSQCRRPADYDLGQPPEDGGEEPADSGSTDDLGTPPDRTPPRVLSTVPANNARNASVSNPIKVVFSEPVREAQVEAAITLFDTSDPSNPLQGVGLTASYDNATKTATITIPANKALKPYTTYRLAVLENIKDTAGNSLDEFPDVFFTTAADEDAETFYEGIARLYAPHVYQETNRELVKSDFLAPVDFDGTWNGEGKFTAYQRANARLTGTLYWNVTETKTHYFITYVSYHPFDYDTEVTARQRENSMYGAQVIVGKEGSGANPGWQGMETYVRDEFWGIGVEGRSLTPRAANEGGLGFKTTMPAEWLLEGARYQAFIPYGTHEACVWGYETEALEDRCRQGGDNRFYHDSGVHYLPRAGSGDGEMPPTTVPAACDPACGAGDFCFNGVCAGTDYGFRSLAAEIWTRVHEYASLGENLWGATFVYQSDVSATDYQQYARPGKGLVFPRSLVSSIDGTPGEPPWAWDDPRDPEIGRGQWFVDPAFALGRHLKPAEGDSWSTAKADYCWNPYLGIYNRKVAGCSGAAQ